MMHRILWAALIVLAGSVALAAPAVAQDERPRVFITDSDSWETRGEVVGVDGGFGRFAGGARPQTVEIMKTFGERCPTVMVNRNLAKADFVVLLDHEGGKGFLRRDNKVAVFAENGDMLFSGSTRMLGNAVKDACSVINEAWISQLVIAKAGQGRTLKR